MINERENFQKTWPYKPKFFLGNGFKQHYVDEGKHNKKTIICLHGEPTWGYVYRNFIKELSNDFRVIVPDHMGFGKSETPLDKDYTLKTHVENLSNLIKYLQINNIYFVGQDWGGPIMGAYALKNIDKVSGFFLINTIFGYSKIERPKELSHWFSWVKKHYKNGTLEGILGELSSTILSVMKIINFTNSKVIDKNWINAYSYAFPDRKSCIGAINFPLDALLGRIVPYIIECLKEGNLDLFLKKPAQLVYGMEDNAIDPDYAIKDFKALFPDKKVTKLENAGHFSQEDEPDKIIALIKTFVNKN